MATLDLNDDSFINNSNDDDDDDDDNEPLTKTIVTLVFKNNNNNTDSPPQKFQLKAGSNIIGRGEPSFLNDIKISRRHAEIIVSSVVGNCVTFNQLGQNYSILFRKDQSPIKLMKGVFNQLQNEDSISLYEGSTPFSIHIEKDNQYMSVCESNIHGDVGGTQEIIDSNNNTTTTSNINNQLNNVNIKSTTTTTTTTSKIATTATTMYNNNNKRERIEEEHNDDEKIKDSSNFNKLKHLNNNSPLTANQYQQLQFQQQQYQLQQHQLQQQQLQHIQLQQQQLLLQKQQKEQQQQQQQQFKKFKKDNTPVLVEDDSLKLNILENELIFIKKIGIGACGEVSQYEWKGTPVAVKIIFKSLLRKDKKEEFDKEVKILKCLRHPNVVLFMGTCLLDGNLSIITEYLNRGSLRDVLMSMGPNELSLTTKVKMLIDVAQGMNYLHTYTPPIIHRDLKSLNLLVDNNFNVKVSDFGLSRFISGSGNAAKTFCGTLSWIAPEVFQGGGYTTKVDVFSFGIVLWEILTHKQPHGNISATSLGHPELPPSCPPPFGDLIKECCNKNPDQRPNFSQILLKLKLIYTNLSNNNSNNNNNNGLSNSNNSLNNGGGNSNSNNNNNSGNGINNNNNNSGQNNNNNNNTSNIHNHQENIKDYTIQPNEITGIKTIQVKDNYSILEGNYKDKLVSIKQFKGSVDEFQIKELNVLASIKSPLAVRFIGVVFNTDEYAVISEHIGNRGNLLSLMQNYSNQFNWSNTLDLAIQLAQSIQYLHKHQPPILHRNITSDCFLIAEDVTTTTPTVTGTGTAAAATAVIVDSPATTATATTTSSNKLDNIKIKIHNFGLSRFNIQENEQSLKEIKGNFLYTPPELLSQNQYTVKSDVYSLSIVFYELFETCLNKVYQKPFHEVSIDFDFQIIHKTSKLNLRPTISKNMPNEISKILQQGWLSDFVLRPSLDTIIRDLQNCKKSLC